jgi:hypothetical protein
MENSFEQTTTRYGGCWRFACDSGDIVVIDRVQYGGEERGRALINR